MSKLENSTNPPPIPIPPIPPPPPWPAPPEPLPPDSNSFGKA